MRMLRALRDLFTSTLSLFIFKITRGKFSKIKHTQKANKENYSLFPIPKKISEMTEGERKEFSQGLAGHMIEIANKYQEDKKNRE